jgi:hypothetical protein
LTFGQLVHGSDTGTNLVHSMKKVSYADASTTSASSPTSVALKLDDDTESILVSFQVTLGVPLLGPILSIGLSAEIQKRQHKRVRLLNGDTHG